MSKIARPIAPEKYRSQSLSKVLRVLQRHYQHGKMEPQSGQKSQREVTELRHMRECCEKRS
jgi:uncharacterized protein with ATP-grasp and redox domains